LPLRQFRHCTAGTGEAAAANAKNKRQKRNAKTRGSKGAEGKDKSTTQRPKGSRTQRNLSTELKENVEHFFEHLFRF